MGFAIVVGPCLVCGNPFGYNPLTVPSHPAKNGFPSSNPTDPKEPICSSCIAIVNEERRKAGQPEWPVYDDSYAPVEEGMI
jgi:hypothetical protein